MNRVSAVVVVLGAILCTGAGSPRVRRVPVNPHVDRKLDEVAEEIRAGKLADAEALLEPIKVMVLPGWEAANRVTQLEATLLAYRGEYERAALAVVKRLADLDDDAGHSTAFRFHALLMMLRATQGDIGGALLECEEMRAAGERGTWTVSGGSRESEVQLAYAWHRALYLRLWAQASVGSKRLAADHYAEGAWRTFRAFAAKAPDASDWASALDVIFAVHNGNRQAALAAARRIQFEKATDLEVLYLAQLGLDFGGDAQAALSVQEKVKSSDQLSPAKPIVLEWLKRDAEAKDHGKASGWTPRHSH